MKTFFRNCKFSLIFYKSFENLSTRRPPYKPSLGGPRSPSKKFLRALMTYPGFKANFSCYTFKVYFWNLVNLYKALFLETTFSQVKNSIFLLNFYQRFSKFSENFPTICNFRQNSEKRTQMFVNSFEKYANIMDVCNFLKKFF